MNRWMAEEFNNAPYWFIFSSINFLVLYLGYYSSSIAQLNYQIIVPTCNVLSNETCLVFALYIIKILA